MAAELQNPSKPPERLLSSRDVSTTQSPDEWNVFRVAPKEREARQRILYLHGGAFVWHMVDAHWEFIDQMVAKTAAEVIIPAYPLAPYPEASWRHGNASTVLPKMAALLDSVAKESRMPVTLMGDSAGGNLALSSLMINRDERQRLPDQTVLLSPWLDLKMPSEQVATITAPGMNLELMRRDAESWRGDVAIESPLVSPANGQCHDLGRIAVFCGTADVVYPGCQRFVDKAAHAAGTSIEYYHYADEPHNNLIAGTEVGLLVREELFSLVGSATK